MFPSETLLISMVCALAQGSCGCLWIGLSNDLSICYQWPCDENLPVLRPCWCLWICIVIVAVAKGHVEVHSHTTASSSGNVHGMKTTEGHKDIGDLCHSLMPRWCPWVMLPLVVMLVLMACPDNGHQIDVSGSYFHQNPCGTLWSVLSLTVKDKEAAFAMALITADSGLRKSRRLLWESLTLLPNTSQIN